VSECQSEIGNQKSEVRKVSECQSVRVSIRSQKSEVRGQKSDFRLLSSVLCPLWTMDCGLPVLRLPPSWTP